MEAIIDLNSGSGFVYGAPSAVCDAGVRVNALIDAALEAEHRSQPPRDYLGGSRIGEPRTSKRSWTACRRRHRCNASSS
jgi:hypothetical protein